MRHHNADLRPPLTVLLINLNKKHHPTSLDIKCPPQVFLLAFIFSTKSMITEYPTHLTLDHTISNRLPSSRPKGDIYHTIKSCTSNYSRSWRTNSEFLNPTYKRELYTIPIIAGKTTRTAQKPTTRKGKICNCEHHHHSQLILTRQLAVWEKNPADFSIE